MWATCSKLGATALRILLADSQLRLRPPLGDGSEMVEQIPVICSNPDCPRFQVRLDFRHQAIIRNLASAGMKDLYVVDGLRYRGGRADR